MGTKSRDQHLGPTTGGPRVGAKSGGQQWGPTTGGPTVGTNSQEPQQRPTVGTGATLKVIDTPRNLETPKRDSPELLF